jgi:hypothetical protein
MDSAPSKGKGKASSHGLGIDDFRDIITELYVGQGNKLEDVMRIMESEHNFKAR